VPASWLAALVALRFSSQEPIVTVSLAAGSALALG
jgi:hypothetical protein